MRKVKIINIFCGSHLFTGKAAAIVAPAGRAKHILPFFFPADILSDEIVPDGLPFMKDDAGRAWIFGWFCKPVADGFILGRGQFGLEGTEQLIPDDKEHPHILVQVFDIGSVVDAMMRRGDQNIFQPAHLVDELSMDEDPPYLGGRIHKDDIQRLKSQQRQRNKVHEPVERLEDG